MRSRLLPLTLAAVAIGFAQDNPVRWSIEEGTRSRHTFTARITARIEDGWHLYSISQAPGGPIPTRIWMPEDQPFQQAGELRGPKPQSSYDSNFSMEVEYYEGTTEFQIPVKAMLTGKRPLQVKASYQTCNDRLCLPPKTVTVELEITR